MGQQREVDAVVLAEAQIGDKEIRAESLKPAAAGLKICCDCDDCVLLEFSGEPFAKGLFRLHDQEVM